MPTFTDKFLACGHTHSTQVGLERNPIVRSEEPGLCYWCEERELDRERAREAEDQKRAARRLR